MRTIRAMIGMPVVCRSRRIGRMIQADISGDLRTLSGIWVDAGIRGIRYIPAEDLEMLGSIAIMTDSCGKRKRLTSSPMFHRAVSTDGRRLGAVTGAEIDPLSFAVEAVELSCGVMDDLVSGRRRICAFTVNRDTGEVVIDPAAQRSEGNEHEKRNGQGTDHRNAHRQLCRDHLRRDELADGEEMESEGPSDRQLDQPQGR